MAVKDSPAARPEPTYAIAELFPSQGQWTEAEYLALETNRIVELSNGRLEVLEMPNDLHQLILKRLCWLIDMLVVRTQLGRLRFAPLRIRLWPGKMREPDLVFMAAVHVDRCGSQYWGAPDLVAEVLSPSDADLDRIIKMQEYAQADIPEYWIVDPENKKIEVYALPAGASEYQLNRMAGVGDTLTSTQLPGLQLVLAELFAEE